MKPKLDFSQKNIKTILIALAAILLIAVAVLAVRINREMKNGGTPVLNERKEVEKRSAPLTPEQIDESMKKNDGSVKPLTPEQIDESMKKAK